MTPKGICPPLGQISNNQMSKTLIVKSTTFKYSKIKCPKFYYFHVQMSYIQMSHVQMSYIQICYMYDFQTFKNQMSKILIFLRSNIVHSNMLWCDVQMSYNQIILVKTRYCLIKRENSNCKNFLSKIVCYVRKFKSAN